MLCFQTCVGALGVPLMRDGGVSRREIPAHRPPRLFPNCGTTRPSATTGPAVQLGESERQQNPCVHFTHETKALRGFVNYPR